MGRKAGVGWGRSPISSGIFPPIQRPGSAPAGATGSRSATVPDMRGTKTFPRRCGIPRHGGDGAELREVSVVTEDGGRIGVAASRDRGEARTLDANARVRVRPDHPVWFPSAGPSIHGGESPGRTPWFAPPTRRLGRLAHEARGTLEGHDVGGGRGRWSRAPEVPVRARGCAAKGEVAEGVERTPGTDPKEARGGGPRFERVGRSGSARTRHERRAVLVSGESPSNGRSRPARGRDADRSRVPEGRLLVALSPLAGLFVRASVRLCVPLGLPARSVDAACGFLRRLQPLRHPR